MRWVIRQQHAVTTLNSLFNWKPKLLLSYFPTTELCQGCLCVFSLPCKQMNKIQRSCSGCAGMKNWLAFQKTINKKYGATWDDCKWKAPETGAICPWMEASPIKRNWVEGTGDISELIFNKVGNLIKKRNPRVR